MTCSPSMSVIRRPPFNDLGIAPGRADAIRQLVDRLLWGQRTIMDSTRDHHGGIIIGENHPRSPVKVHPSRQCAFNGIRRVPRMLSPASTDSVIPVAARRIRLRVTLRLEISGEHRHRGRPPKRPPR